MVSRRWYQFSLRTLLIAVAIVAGATWYLYVEPYRLQRKAMAAITELGGRYTTESAAGLMGSRDKNAQDVVMADLADCDQPGEYLPHLARLPRLRTLVIGGHQVGDEQLAALRRVTGLRRLVLDSTLVTEAGVNGLRATLPELLVHRSQRRAIMALEKLDVTWGNILDGGRKPFREPVPPEWSGADIEDRYFYIPPGGIHIRNTDGDLSWLIHLSDLERVTFDGPRVSQEALAHLAALQALASLIVSHTNISDQGLLHVARCSSLTTLDLSATNITDEGISQLKTLTRLEHLRLDDTRVTDAGLRSIANLRQLRSFSAPQGMGNEGLAILAGLPGVGELYLSRCNVSDEGLEPLGGVRGLKVLWCDGTKITNAGIPHLKACTALEFLRIQNTGITAGGFERLKKALPNCHIYWRSAPHPN